MLYAHLLGMIEQDSNMGRERRQQSSRLTYLNRIPAILRIPPCVDDINRHRNHPLIAITRRLLFKLAQYPKHLLDLTLLPTVRLLGRHGPHPSSY